MSPGWSWLGRLPFEQALARQHRVRERLLGGDQAGAEPGEVLLAEHDPVITLGRSADRGHVLATDAELRERGVDVVRIDRGGDVTYHGPGQLMIYPVVRLRGGLVDFLCSIAAVIVEVAAELGVGGAAWQCDPAGVWVGAAKLAACGVHLRRRVVTHGFALDVSTPADAWQSIVPCGLIDRGNTSLDRARRAAGLPPAPSVAEVARLVGPRLVDRLAGRRAVSGPV